MNILVTTNQLAVGGAEHFVVRLSNELTRRGHRITVATAGGELESLLDPTIRQVVLPTRTKSPWGLRKLAEDYRALLIQEQIDLVHANSPTTALAARWGRRELPIPVIVSAHGVWQEWAKPGVAALFALGADRVVGCSLAITNDLVRYGLPVLRAATIHNGIPTPPEANPESRPRLRQGFGVLEEGTVILTAARLVTQKGIPYLLDAMPMILSECPRTQLWLAGDGPLRAKLEWRVQKLHLKAQVRFLGNRSDVPDLLSAADLFCLPSISEGLPLSIAEAMSASLPVVATTVGGVPEIVRNGVTGWLVPPRQPALLAGRLLSLLRDPEWRSRMGEAGRLRFKEAFTLDRMVSAFEGLYEAQRLPRGAAWRAL